MATDTENKREDVRSAARLPPGWLAVSCVFLYEVTSKGVWIETEFQSSNALQCQDVTTIPTVDVRYSGNTTVIWTNYF